MADRREILKLFAAAGILGHSGAAEAQDPSGVTAEMLERAAELLETGFEPSRIRELLPSIARNRDFFRIVRELEIEDAVEPSPIFHARRREDV